MRTVIPGSAYGQSYNISDYRTEEWHEVENFLEVWRKENLVAVGGGDADVDGDEEHTDRAPVEDPQLRSENSVSG